MHGYRKRNAAPPPALTYPPADGMNTPRIGIPGCPHSSGYASSTATTAGASVANDSSIM